MYPSRFHRLVLIGKLYTDDFNTTLSIVPDGPGSLGITSITTQLLGDLADQLQLFWSGSGFEITSNAVLHSFKLNEIGPDGKYVQETTNEFVFGTPVPGGHPIFPPAQIAVAITLRTGAERGPASKGRMYFPGMSGYDSVDGSGRAGAAAALTKAQTAARMFEAINTAYATSTSGDEARARVGVASKVGAGRFRPVTHVTVGRVPDTIRSRRSSLVEDPQDSGPLAGA